MEEGFSEFQCSEKVQAKPMTRREFVDYTGQVPRSDYNHYEQGYAVINPNMPRGETCYWPPVLSFIAGHTKIEQTS